MTKTTSTSLFSYGFGNQHANLGGPLQMWISGSKQHPMYTTPQLSFISICIGSPYPAQARAHTPLVGYVLC
ncbi:hypothetical protein Hanom_Chr16g01439901 [Helianthus anomalus]